MPEFDRLAPNYKEIVDQTLTISGETSAYFAEYKARYTARAVVRPEFSGKILDFGCGIGLLSGFLRKHFPASRLHGFDVSPESIQRIHPDLHSHGLFTSNLADLDGDYDVIVVSNVMHHARPEHRQTVISALRERLVQTGKLVVFEHNPMNPVTRWVVHHSPIDRDAILLPRRETMAYLDRAGLHLIRRAYIVFFPRFLSRLRLFEPWLSWCPLGAQYALVAERTDRRVANPDGQERL
jgi:2-polyprenyl-3-methyl-5-hydroxy-6-metoxy-1,4-benzoquinol methylase